VRRCILPDGLGRSGWREIRESLIPLTTTAQISSSRILASADAKLIGANTIAVEISSGGRQQAYLGSHYEHHGHKIRSRYSCSRRGGPFTAHHPKHDSSNGAPTRMDNC